MDVSPDWIDDGAKLGMSKGISGRVMRTKTPAVMMLIAPAR